MEKLAAIIPRPTVNLLITVEGIIGVGDGEVWLDNVGHFASRRLAAAKGTASRFRDHALSFDNTGRNGRYSAIEWSGG